MAARSKGGGPDDAPREEGDDRTAGELKARRLEDIEILLRTIPSELPRRRKRRKAQAWSQVLIQNGRVTVITEREACGDSGEEDAASTYGYGYGYAIGYGYGAYGAYGYGSYGYGAYGYGGRRERGHRRRRRCRTRDTVVVKVLSGGRVEVDTGRKARLAARRARRRFRKRK